MSKLHQEHLTNRGVHRRRWGGRVEKLMLQDFARLSSHDPGAEKRFLVAIEHRHRPRDHNGAAGTMLPRHVGIN